MEAGFDAEDAACYKKFFVNMCLNEVKERRRDAMAELKRQEVVLNDETRKRKAEEQIAKTAEKNSLEVQQQAAERRAKALEDERSRVERTRLKAQERGDLKQQEPTNAAEAANKIKGSEERAQARGEKQAASAEEVKKYNDKQREIRERKASREKELREQTKPAAKPLPTPAS
ncbi:MAG TPA: hypothetical protein VE934_13145 [Polaromonas sp.]|nr:hypothetical protein [Polaromonas sp.]